MSGERTECDSTSVSEERASKARPMVAGGCSRPLWPGGVARRRSSADGGHSVTRKAQQLR
eukprot:9503703-Pyramimonas_sp.AAC.1